MEENNNDNCKKDTGNTHKRTTQKTLLNSFFCVKKDNAPKIRKSIAKKHTLVALKDEKYHRDKKLKKALELTKAKFVREHAPLIRERKKAALPQTSVDDFGQIVKCVCDTSNVLQSQQTSATTGTNHIHVGNVKKEGGKKKKSKNESESLVRLINPPEASSMNQLRGNQ